MFGPDQNRCKDNALELSVSERCAKQAQEVPQYRECPSGFSGLGGCSALVPEPEEPGWPLVPNESVYRGVLVPGRDPVARAIRRPSKFVDQHNQKKSWRQQSWSVNVTTARIYLANCLLLADCP